MFFFAPLFSPPCKKYTNFISADTDLPPTEATVLVSSASSLGCANSTLFVTLVSTLATWVVALLSLSFSCHKFATHWLLCLTDGETKSANMGKSFSEKAKEMNCLSEMCWSVQRFPPFPNHLVMLTWIVFALKKVVDRDVLFFCSKSARNSGDDRPILTLHGWSREHHTRMHM
jgi:hypothetical protein